MRVFKNKAFSRWAAKEGLNDQALRTAITEIAAGQVEANLGGQLYKKRVAIQGRGKRGGMRTLVAYKSGERAFFLYGFAKNARANIKDDEEKALKLLAKTLMGYSDKVLAKAVKAGEYIEVEANDG